MRSFKQVRARVVISIAIVAGSMSLTYAGLTVYHQRFNKPAAASSEKIIQPSKPKLAQAAHVYSLPSRLVIPKLSVDASILPMGVTATGAMESPKTNKDTGWYSLGARPGNVGSAVIAGHLGLKNEAVFGKLQMLTAGDGLSVTDDQGATESFIVREVKKYAKDSDTTDIFSSSSGAHLNLITCNGDWESSQATYDKRLVVFTDKV
jgi:sortase A